MILTIELTMIMLGKKAEIDAVARRFETMYQQDAAEGGFSFLITDQPAPALAELLRVNDLAVEHFEHLEPRKMTFLDDEPEVTRFSEDGWQCEVTIFCDQIPTHDIEALSEEFPAVMFACGARVTREDDWDYLGLAPLSDVSVEATCWNGVWR